MIGVPADRVTLRSWLTWYHLLAGVAGIWVTLGVMPSLLDRVATDVKPYLGLVAFAMLGLFATVGWTGVLLSMRSPRAERMVVFVQALQIPVVSVHAYYWAFFAGGYLVPYWQTAAGMSGIVGVKAAVTVSWGHPSPPTLIGVNLIPPVIIWLARYRLPAVERADASRVAAVSQYVATASPEDVSTF